MAIIRVKKYKATIRWTRQTLFNADIVLILCEWDDFYKTSKKVLDKEKLDELKLAVEKHGKDKYSLATQFPLSGGGSIIWANPKANIGTLVHELVHVAFNLLRERATPLTSETEETYAYLIEFLFNNLTRKKK